MTERLKPIQQDADVRIDPTLDDLTQAQLQAMMPRCAAGVWHPLLVTAMAPRGIVTPARVVAFLAQVAHESAELTHLEEGMSYSAERLLVVWRKRFPTLVSAQPYVRQPEKLANFVYGPRVDLGNRGEASGDGWRYRGGGPIQLTGRTHFTAAAAATGHPLVERPELLRTPGQAAADSAAWFWQLKGCNVLADACGLELTLDQVEAPWRALTKRVRGVEESWQERLTHWDRMRAVMRAA